MYFNKSFSALLIAVTIGYAVSAIAQETTTTAPAAAATTQSNSSVTPSTNGATAPAAADGTVAPATPAPVVPVDASTVVPANPVVEQATTINQIPMDASKQVMLQSVMLVNLPKADNSIVDKLVEAFNSRSYEKYSEMFSKEGFSVVTADFKNISTPEALKTAWESKFAATSHFKDAKATATVDSVRDIAPGIALITGKMNIAVDPKTNAMSMFTILAKYEENTWRIATMHASSKDLMKMILASEIKPESNVMMDVILAFAGVVIGFVLAKVMRKRSDMNA